MPWTPPTADEISKSLRAAVRAELPAADPWVWPSNLAVLVKVFAQALRALHLRLAWIHRQAFVATAEAEGLEQHGVDLGITRLPSTFATGRATITTVIGTAINTGARLTRGDGFVYVVTVGVIASSVSTVVPIRAVADGKAGNAIAATPLALETPAVGAGAIAVDVNGLTGGADVENDSSLRARILHRKANPPHGGSPQEYVQWARQMAGVTRVWVKRATPAPGSVTILFMMEDTYPAGIPLGGDVAALRAQLSALAPASANIVVAAPTPMVVNVSIDDLSPDNSAVRDAVRSELLAMFRRRAEPGTAAASFVFSRSWIVEAIAMATGEFSHRLIAPANDVNCGDGQIAVLGTVTFV